MGIERGNEKGKDRKAERLWDDGMTEKEARAREGGEGKGDAVEEAQCARRGEQPMGVIHGAIWNRHNLQLSQEIEPRRADAKVRREQESRS